MNYKGLTIQGYSIVDPETNGPSGLRTCGTIEVGNMCCYQGNSTTFEDTLEYIRTFGYPQITDANKKLVKKNAANILFAITNVTLLQEPTLNFSAFLLHHPNTHILYGYKNDAHGPNCVYICMNHRNLPIGFVHNIEEYRTKLRCNNFQYFVE